MNCMNREYIILALLFYTVERWAVYRPGNGKFDVENIDPFLCTHVIYAFVGLNWDGTVRVMDTWNELDLKALTRFTSLKKTNPNLKTLVAIGGWNEGSVVFSQVAGDAALRAKFVTSAYDFVKAYGFDAVSASVASVSVSYNIPEIVKYVNFVNLMTYDFHGSWEKTAGINSPLYPSSIDTDLTINSVMNDAAVRYWIQQGAPPLKLLLGAPMFGRTYTLLNANSPGIGAATTGPGAVGPYTQESGFIGYNELCESMKTTTWNVNWATQQKVPFAFKGTQWVGYDNKESVRIKAEYAKWKGIGGMLAGVSADAYPATQGPWMPSTVVWADPAATTTKAPVTTTTATTTKAPVTTTTATTTKAPVTTTTVTTTKAPVTTTKAPVTTTTVTTTKAPVTTTTATTTQAPITTTATTTTKAPVTSTTTKAPTTTASSTSFKCTTVGYFRDPTNCAVYYYCQAVTGGYNAIRFQCDPGLVYDTVLKTIVTENVVCYYSSWATYRPGNGKFDVETIDPFLCTHVIYAFVGLNWDGTVRVMDTWNEIDNRALTRFTDLKKKNPNLKTLLAIGGWNEGSVVFSQVAGSAALRSTFVTSAYNFVMKYGFNGLDVDWEYPAQRGGAAADKANFVTLLKDLNTKFAPAGLIISVAVSATDATVRYWIQQGAPSGKLHLGGAMYGRSYTLRTASSAGAEYAKMKGLGGMLVWGIETDDFRNICGQGKFPLVNSIKSSLNAYDHETNDYNNYHTANYNYHSSNDHYHTANHNYYSFNYHTANHHNHSSNYNYHTANHNYQSSNYYYHTANYNYHTANHNYHSSNYYYYHTANYHYHSANYHTANYNAKYIDDGANHTNYDHKSVDDYHIAHHYHNHLYNDKDINIKDTASCSTFYYCQALQTGGYTASKFNCPSGLFFDTILLSTGAEMRCCVLLIFAAAAFAVEMAAAQKKLVCYYGSWSTYRPGNGKCDIEHLNASLCTHAIYSFIGVNSDATIKILDTWNDISLNGFKRFNDLRIGNPNLKTLIAIGGWNEGSTTFSSVCGNTASRAKFVNNLYTFVKQYGFNGLDLDWEYPAQRGGASADKANFVSLVKELKAKFALDNLILSAAVSASISSVATSYDVVELSNNLDFINLMTYDYHGPWESVTAQNAPLYAGNMDADKNLNANATVQYWKQQGAPASKLVLGIPFYGRTWTLKIATSNSLGAAATGADL
ncbi:hypothetical protein B566_EDAN015640 [Ephemera danica]|nr:hypothetical protein B566_EDAN015640 [Ephemera danica]